MGAGRHTPARSISCTGRHRRRDSTDTSAVASIDIIPGFAASDQIPHEEI
jgi:hypothetical protein